MAFWLYISSFMSIEFIPCFSALYSYYEIQDTYPILLILRIFILHKFFSVVSLSKRMDSKNKYCTHTHTHTLHILPDWAFIMAIVKNTMTLFCHDYCQYILIIKYYELTEGEKIFIFLVVLTCSVTCACYLNCLSISLIYILNRVDIIMYFIVNILWESWLV